MQWEPNVGQYSILVPSLFRIGLSNRFEARVEGSAYTWVDEDGERQSGLPPLSVGVKAAIVHGEGRTPGLGFIGRLFPAWGTGEFESNRVTGEVRLALDWAFADRWSLNPNVGIGWYEGEEQTFTTTLFALTLTYARRANTAWFVDTGWRSAEVEGGVSAMLIDAGVAYIPRQDWQFDISGGRRAFGSASAQGFVAVGIAYRHK